MTTSDHNASVTKKKLAILAAIVAVSFACTEAFAYAALAYDDISGILGWGVASTRAGAETKARNKCIGRGGTMPIDWFWYDEAGYGACAGSYESGGAWYIGGALGYATKRRAKRVALRECRDAGGSDCQIVKAFYDQHGGARKQRGRGKSFGFSSNSLP
jgi:hypothetical protein